MMIVSQQGGVCCEFVFGICVVDQQVGEVDVQFMCVFCGLDEVGVVVFYWVWIGEFWCELVFYCDDYVVEMFSLVQEVDYVKLLVVDDYVVVVCVEEFWVCFCVFFFFDYGDDDFIVVVVGD